MSIRSRAATKQRPNGISFPESIAYKLSSSISVALWIAFIGLMIPAAINAQSKSTSIRFDEQTQVFHIDAADMSYVLGINEKKEIQTLYWGKRLNAADSFGVTHSASGLSGFDSSINTTQQEFTGWGGGLYVEPDLKITFPDGNRDLV